MSKLCAVWDKTKYALMIFAALIFNMFMAIDKIGLPHTYAGSYSMYLLDYSFGFCARFFPGQVYRWIMGPNYNPETVLAFMRAELLIVFVLLSVMLNWFILSAGRESRKYYICLALYYVSGPVTFSLYSYGLGLLDTMWVIFTPVFIMLLMNKYARYIAPVLTVPIILVHFSAITCYMILVFFILLYLASSKKEKKERIIYSALFVVSFITGVALTVYFILFESSNIKYSSDELMRLVTERSWIGDDTDLLYVNFDIFKIVKFKNSFSLFDGIDFPYESLNDVVLISEDSSLPPFIVKTLNAIWPNMHFHLQYYFGKGRIPDELTSIIKQTVFISPVLVFIFMYWRHRIQLAKEEKNRFQRFLFFLAIIYFPVALVFWFFFSIDHFRYFNHIMITEGGFLLFVMYSNKEDTAQWLKTTFGRFDKRVFFLYTIIYVIIGRVSG